MKIAADKEGVNSMDGASRVAFLSGWLSDNKAFINKQMGIEVGNKYLSGILFTTSVGLQVAPHPLPDGCHVNLEST